jgi:hypothetical protein
VPPPLPIRVAEARTPGGSVALSPAGTTEVPGGSAFEVSVGARVDEARLQLLDARDAAVPASGTTVIDAETRFTLAPDEPLRPGEYVLRLEGLRSAPPRTADGTAFAPAAWRVSVAGTASAQPARRKAKRPSRGAPPAE